jgi:hypothetical protein
MKKTNIKNTSVTNFPKSVHGQQCIGPCYFAGSKIYHPITMDEIIFKDNSCPVNNFVYVDKNGQKKVFDHDQCYIPTAKETYIDDFFEMNILTPQAVFNSDYFIKIYYNINSLEDMFDWLSQNKNNPYKTKERVFNQAMNVYGSSINIIDHRLIDFVNDIMIQNIKKIYNHVKKYIIIKNEEVFISSIKNDDSDDSNINDNKKNKKIKIAYIKEKLLGSDNVQKFMSWFTRSYLEQYNDKISDVLVEQMIKYIIKKIKQTFLS